MHLHFCDILLIIVSFAAFMEFYVADQAVVELVACLLVEASIVFVNQSVPAS